MEKRPVAYQIYSARDEACKDLEGVLRALSEMGYDGVEFAGFYGLGVPEIKALLDKYHLRAISDHVPLALIEKDMYQVIADHAALGCEYVAVPYLDEAHRPGAGGFAATIKLIYKFARLCKEEDLQLLYHNHDFEFVRLSDQYGLDFLYDAVPTGLLKTELDVCWIKYAGEDPAAYLRKYAGRCPVVHLKDYVGVKGEDSPYGLIGLDDPADKKSAAFEFRPFGFGCQDVEGVLEAAIESGAQWFVVEQDMPWQGTPLENAKQSMETLRKAGLK